MSGLIWIQNVWHSDGIPERNFGKDSVLKKSADDKRACKELLDWPQSLMSIFFSKTDYLSNAQVTHSRILPVLLRIKSHG